MEKDDKAAGETKDGEREICRMGVMDNIDMYTLILEVIPSLELCTVIPRASKNLKKVVEAKFFKFVIQRDKGKEEMFRVYVKKKGEILKLRGESRVGGIRQTNKDSFFYWFVGTRYMVELDGGSMQIIRRPASTCYMLEDDYSLKQFEILKEYPGMKGLSTHACMSTVTKVVFEEPMETPSLFFPTVPKVIFGGWYVILFRAKRR
uniref:Uncharacterized protein n=1 Tax=Tanacetum cinerariifolium TaxID=118510 RepID=A0A6L2JG75_TANCI|nr:hypothetical protein [Tanacetum cinerariifolium]